MQILNKTLQVITNTFHISIPEEAVLQRVIVFLEKKGIERNNIKNIIVLVKEEIDPKQQLYQYIVEATLKK